MDVARKLSIASPSINLSSLARRDSLAVAALFVILAVALGLRLFGLNWDEGYSYTPHPDERAILSKVEQLSLPSIGEIDTLLDAEESPWNPRWFPYGSLPLYGLRTVQYVSGIGPFDQITDLRIAGRTISALADLATVLLVYLLGTKVYGRRVGLLASTFVALAVIHIQLSHFFAVDTLLSLFTIATIYFLYRVAREGRPRDSIIAGILIGLGLATKVSLAPILGSLVVAHVMYAFSMSGDSDGHQSTFEQRWPVAIKGLAVAGVVSFGVLFIAQPYTFLDWGTFYGDVIEQSEMVRRIRDYPYTRQYVDTTPYLYHIRQLATFGLGWPAGVVAWAGLLYASLRGMRPRFGIAYLGLGWVVPMAILLFSGGFPAVILASGFALAALLLTLPVRSPDSRSDVLLLSWVVPYFLITGAFHVKFLRYMIPITPFLLLFGSRMMFAIWDWASELPIAGLRSRLRPLLLAVGLLIVGATAFYAVSYTSIYREPHPAVRAAQWINDDAQDGAVVLKEHWEESLPDLGRFAVRELPLYENDDARKIGILADELERGDYLTFYSSRLYGTIPRLPERYPISTQYYNLLFSGELGYELVDFETSYPELFGISFVNDTFGRPNVFEPDALRDFEPSPISLNLGFADESFSVYDHPKVLVLKNVGHLDSETIQSMLEDSAPTSLFSRDEANTREVGLLFSPELAQAQQDGGTWTDIVHAGSLANRFPVLAWVLVIEVIALLALPITFFVFRPLPDRGYLFSKVLGLLIVGVIVWLLASLRWMAFSSAAVGLAIVLMAIVSGFVVSRYRDDMLGFVKSHWKILLIGEAIFLIAFFAFLAIRSANPDLWHPFRGGEKPMDIAYLNAVLKSSYMPPYDPWFSGGYLNYYYWGQFSVATLIQATGINPDVAFNLAIPLFFALLVGGSFALVYNLAEGTRRKLHDSGTASPSDAQAEQSHIESRYKLHWSPVLAGIGGVLFVTVLGNLDGAIQVGWGVWRAAFNNLPFGEFDFWQSSRMMAPDPPGNEITEFPFFTFLFADLHAHLMALPFTVLVLGLALAVISKAAQLSSRLSNWSVDQLVRLAVLGVAIGVLRLVNAWDYPTYLIIGVASVYLAEYFAHGGLGLQMAFRAGVKSAIVFAVGYVVFLPFIQNYETFFNSVESTTNTTVLWQFLAISGLFIFVIGSFFILESRDWLSKIGTRIHQGYVELLRAMDDSVDANRSLGGVRIGAGIVAGIVVGALILGFGLTAMFSGAGGSTIPFVAVLLLLVVVTGVRTLFGNRVDAVPLTFVALLVMVSLALVIGLDVVRVEGDIDRMNSVFKFYLQVWVMLALSSAYLLWRLAHGKRVPIARLAVRKKAWVVAVAVLIVSASVYPILGTQDRLRDRFNDHVIPLTLDGTAYVDDTVYRDESGDIKLDVDFEGIQWLRDNVVGSPVVLEGMTPTYRWGGRISIYTGLPSVVGWQWHQQQQRWDYRFAVDQRIDDVNKIYRTTDPAEALALLNKYGVTYVYVGQLEKLYYPSAGLEKFETAFGSSLSKIVVNDEVTIYRVNKTAF